MALSPAEEPQGSAPWVRKQPAIRNTGGRSWVPHAPRVPAWARQFTEAALGAVKDRLAEDSPAEDSVATS